jgi:ribosomal protein S12 methylthiotransferase accessory factor
LSAVAQIEPLDVAKRYFLGTHRACAPQETLARLRPLLRDMGITRIANVTGLDRTGIPVVMVCRPNARSLTVSQGKGLTLEAAKASGVMEAVEAWHAERIMRPLVLASFEELRSEHRVADVAALPQVADSRFTKELPLLWIEARDLFRGESVWVPYELVSANYSLPLPPGSGCFQANTNGLASGNHWAEAASHALCEVVERDATTLWKQLSPRAQAERVLDPDSVDDPACREVIEKAAAAGLQWRVWDTTSDVGIACFACLLMGPGSDNADPEFGGGCHPARHIALLRALTEAAQARTTFIAGARDDYFPHLYDAEERARRRMLCERLLQSPAQPRAYADVASFDSPSLDGDLRWILARLRAAGFDQALAVDLSREAMGVPVMRAIVPGLEGVMDAEHGDYAPGRRARRCLEETGKEAA